MKVITYPIPTKNIYAGKLLKLKTLTREKVIGTDGSENNIYTQTFISCRTVLYTRGKDNKAHDLLYDSPDYPIVESLGLVNGEKNSFVVEEVLKMGPILEYFGYPDKLNIEQVASIRKFFSLEFFRDNCQLFGYRKRSDDEVIGLFGDDLKDENEFKKIKRQYENYKKNGHYLYCYDFDVKPELPRDYFDKLTMLSGNPIGKDKYGDSCKLDIFRPGLFQEGRVKKLIKTKEEL